MKKIYDPKILKFPSCKINGIFKMVDDEAGSTLDTKTKSSFIPKIPSKGILVKIDNT